MQRVEAGVEERRIKAMVLYAGVSFRTKLGSLMEVSEARDAGASGTAETP